MRLAVVLLIVLFYPLPVKAGTVPVAVTQNTVSGSAQIEADAFIYDEHARRDPFWSLVTPTGAIVTYDTTFSVSEMMLEGIVSDGQGGVAIINGKVLEQGKAIGGYEVFRIEKDKVILLKDGQESVLRLKKEE